MRSAEKRQQLGHPLEASWPRRATNELGVTRRARALDIIIMSVENGVEWVHSLASLCLDLTKARQAVPKQRDGTSPTSVVWDTRAGRRSEGGIMDDDDEATESSRQGAAAW